jgi:tetratricopeptide (TPR) repeat protein
MEVAERTHAEALTRYRGVSPFPVARVDLQHGLKWLQLGDLSRARARFDAAQRRVPAYAPAHGHLAEVEAAMGEREVAIARLRPLVKVADDPHYPASLARILREAGQVEQASAWRNTAAARYEELVARHPEAFADHTAEFWR